MEVALFRFVFFLGIVSVVLGTRAHAAQVDYFLKLEGIEGESQDRSHGEKLQGVEFSYAVHQPSAGEGGGGSGKVTHHEPLVVTATFSREFISIFETQFGCKECRVKRLVLHSIEMNGNEKRTLQTVELENVRVLQLEPSNPESPSESLTITFGAVRIRYSSQNGKNDHWPFSQGN